MSVEGGRGATRTKTDGVFRPRPMGIWRFDLTYLDFGTTNQRTGVQVQAVGHDTLTDVMVLKAWAEVDTAFAGPTGDITLDVGVQAGPSNAFLTSCDLTGTGKVGTTAAERGVDPNDGRLGLVESNLTITVDAGAGFMGVDLTDGAVSVYVAYVEAQHQEHVVTPGLIPVVGVAPAAETLGASDNVFADGIVLGHDSGEGIKLDEDAPAYGWRDMLSPGPVVRGAGGNDPTWAVWKDGIRQYQYGSNDGTHHCFHIPHDYAPGTDLHIHAHWSQDTVDTGGPASVPGDAEWGFEVTYAKGHDQAPFSTTITTTITATASTVQHQHMISEIQLSASAPSGTQIDTNELEPDGVIVVRFYRGTGTDTLDQDPFVHFIDIHYQSTGIPTKNKAPDFYA